MNKTDAIALILRQLAGGVSPDEEQALDAWLAQDPEHDVLCKRIMVLHGADWQSLPLSPPPDFFTLQRETLLQHAAELEARKQRTQTRIRMVAVVTLAVLASLFIYFTTRHALRPADTLSFSDAELHRVAQTLEQVYHIHVMVDESPGALRFTGQFVNAPVTDVLTALTASLPITVAQRHYSYVLKARD